MKKTDKEWRQILTPQQFAVLREKATEAPFSGEYDGLYADGVYACAACGQVLFDSTTKFDARCGWPSFYDARPGSVEFHTDDSLGTVRTEVTCANCGGHLGHIFEGEGFDTPTDKRYCINSLSLKFTPEPKNKKMTGMDAMLAAPRKQYEPDPNKSFKELYHEMLDEKYGFGKKK